MSYSDTLNMTGDPYFAIGTYSLPLYKAPLPFDVFLRLNKSKFAKVFSEGTEIEQTRFDSYILKGIQKFHIRRDDLRKYNLMNQNVLQRIRKDGGVSRDESLQAIDEFAAQVLSEILGDTMFDNKCYDLALTLIDTYLEMARTDFHVLPALLKLARQRPTHLKHAITVSIFSVLLARAVDTASNDFVLAAGLAGLLHDVGLNRLPAHINEMDLNLPAVDRRQLELHPRFTVEIVSQAPHFPDKVKEAILQHHECWDGSGYPEGKRETQICLLARILAVADSFAGLTGASQNAMPLAPALAITLMRKNSRLDPTLVAKFAKMLNL